MKDIKDFLPYYLGCEVLVEPVEYDDYIDTIEAIVVGESVNLKKSGDYYFDDVNEFSIKLMLRRLSDITEEEWSDIESKSSVAPDAWGYNGLRDNFKKAGKDYRFHWSIVNETLIELRKRGVDVDGLIDAGLAINKTKLPTNER